MPDSDFLKAALPLFINGEIAVLEWSCDTILSNQEKPDWLTNLLQEFSNANRLLGHGVFFSLLDAKWTEKQSLWIKQLKKEISELKYNHISEHFGFMSSGDFHSGCPLPVPLNKSTLTIGIDRMKRLQDAIDIPVGLENLAFSFSKNDVAEQGEFLERLIEPVNGFIILDLHNIYCQSQNFKIDMEELIQLYPLDAVKEIHISGGSWETVKGSDRKIRRDTHDQSVPRELFEVLPWVLSQCTHLEFIIFERLGGTLGGTSDSLRFQSDFRRLKQIVETSNSTFTHKTWGNKVEPLNKPLVDHQLHQDQILLKKSLLLAVDHEDIGNNFENWDTSTWDKDMIDTAISLSKKWD